MSEHKTLAERYSPEAMAKAELRRLRLNAVSIHVGQKTSPDIDRILRLLFQAHQSYYFGHFDTTATLCGILLEQCIYTLLDEEIALRGRITIRERGQTVPVTTNAHLRTLPLYKMIGTAGFLGIIPHDERQLAVDLRLLRNQLIHSGFPALKVSGSIYEAEIPANPHDGLDVNMILEIPADEISAHCLSDSADEVWAYFLLTRTRILMSAIFKARVSRLPPKPKEE